MIFARYIGTNKRFTAGKVYLAQPEFDNSTIANFNFIDVEDDSGFMVRVNHRVERVDKPDGEPSWTDRWDFEFLEEVYAVVIKPYPDLKVGQVVVVEEVSDALDKSMKWFTIKGIGVRNSDGFVILDHTNVYPGVMLLDSRDGVWEKIRSVDECLWVTLEGGGPRRSPEEFRFAIDRDGDIMVVPMVECIDATGGQELTKGNFYYIVRERTDVEGAFLTVRDDLGVETEFFSSRFKT